MTKVCAAQDIGSDAMLLVAVILHIEDAKRYGGPVSFYNGQLIPILGFTSWGRLDRARKSATKSGWLYYESRGKRQAGLYWGMVPKQYENLDDSPIDEDDYNHFIDGDGGNQEVEVETTTTLSTPVEVETGLKRDSDVIETGQCGEPPTLTLNPIPNPKKEIARATRFVIPTLDQVRAYCRERKNRIDAEHFIDHYESNGWKIGGKGPMKDWKAAVRTWEKNDVGGKGKHQGEFKTGAEKWLKNRQETDDEN